ncbi:MAG: hypothetical protein CSB24_00260 [Deltaproteobacteria bacterium]|nr:MAG: hypothetical protein CSB24_00260 [Deltaproteobacteria bacterium]
MTSPANKNYNQRRRKLWQISSSYYCSIMGICLSRAKLQKLKRKKVFDLDSSLSDYHIHNRFSGLSGSKTPQSRTLHKELDTTYRAAVKKYAECRNPEEIISKWQQDFTEGSMAGAYWAIMTHPESDRSVIDRIYGDCHMKSFECFTAQRRENMLLGKYRDESINLKKVLEQQQAELAEEKRKRQAEGAEANRNLQKLKKYQLDNDRLKKLGDELSAKLASHTAYQQLDETRAALLQEQRQTALLTEQIDQLHARLNELENNRNRLEEQIFERDFEIQMLKEQGVEQQFPAAAEMAEEDFTGSPSCESCNGDCVCPMNNVLNGKTVLYVGGQRKMISRYKQVIEQSGGEFIYHDGGHESAKHMLPKLLTGADAVFCPIDCVSHDACKCVKKFCKKYQKPFVMMRSSGVSSLAKELETINHQIQ